jgi:hypothetical protein
MGLSGVLTVLGQVSMGPDMNFSPQAQLLLQRDGAIPV